MYRDIFKRIIEASQTESLTFFVGAGISKLSNAPKWSELIDAFCDNLGRAKKSDYSKIIIGERESKHAKKAVKQKIRILFKGFGELDDLMCV